MTTSGVSCPLLPGVSRLLVFMAVYTRLADLIVSGAASVPTSPLGGGLRFQLSGPHPAPPRFCGSTLQSCAHMASALFTDPFSQPGF